MIHNEHLCFEDMPSVSGILIRKAKSRALEKLVLEELTWTMRDGTEIRVKDMSYSHLNNCINMISRSKIKGHPDSVEMLKLLKLELKLRME